MKKTISLYKFKQSTVDPHQSGMRVANGPVCDDIDA